MRRREGVRQVFQEPGDSLIFQLQADKGLTDKKYECERRKRHTEIPGRRNEGSENANRNRNVMS